MNLTILIGNYISTKIVIPINPSDIMKISMFLLILQKELNQFQ